MNGRIFDFEVLKEADLVVDAIYKGGRYKDVRDDPIDPLIGGGNQGGFRYVGSPRDLQITHCILYTSLEGGIAPTLGTLGANGSPRLVESMDIQCSGSLDSQPFGQNRCWHLE
jgi:hypothetical protein